MNIPALLSALYSESERRAYFKKVVLFSLRSLRSLR